MTERETLKLALEAMTYADACLKKQLTTKSKHEYAQDLLLEAGNAIKEVLAQPEQEPVAWANPHDLQNFDMKVRTNGGPLHTVPLYTTPPQRTWVGLTDEEVRQLCGSVPAMREAVREAEAKLKEKNGL